jgi:hypothetical protein
MTPRSYERQGIAQIAVIAHARRTNNREAAIDNYRARIIAYMSGGKVKEITNTSAALEKDAPERSGSIPSTLAQI